jgi:flavin reductase (DIM6/NTAB) family NADH-FMN oxidoreductase RutF
MSFSDLSNPKQTILVSCRNETKGKDNIIAVDWHMPLSKDPQLYAISIGKSRYSLDIIRESQCFVVNYMSIEQKDQVNFCGMHSGMHVDKFKECGFTKAESNTIDCPKIEEAAANLECEIIQEVDTGDHILFVARVTNSNENNSVPRIMHIGNAEFKTIE